MVVRIESGEFMDIGKRIVRLREMKGWSQREIANRVKLNVSVMNRIESGERPIKDHELVEIARVLDTSSDYLLGITQDPTHSHDNNQDKTFFMSKIATEFPDIDLMFKDMESLSADEMKEVYEYIKFKVSQKKSEG